MAIRRVIKKQENTSINPFEVRDNSKLLMESLASIDKRDIRTKFKNTQDPINLAFDAFSDMSVKTLAKEFVKESINDFISTVREFCS